MAGSKKAAPPPIDRPLSKAYLRNFTGWSTAYPPGASDPTSCRKMENVAVGRNGALAVRPGLRYLSYARTPDTDPLIGGVPGIAYDRPIVGDLEPFYVVGGARAFLFAVRETTGTVGFRAMLLNDTQQVVYHLTDPKIGFIIPQGVTTLEFSSRTRYVRYLQIDNKIFACSDIGEPLRLFTVGGEKTAKKLNTITQPEWSDDHKLKVVQPSRAWIDKLQYQTARNELLNASFQEGKAKWNKSDNVKWDVDVTTDGVNRKKVLRVWSKPQRANLATSPLHNVSRHKQEGWQSDIGSPKLDVDGDDLKLVDAKGKGLFLMRSTKLLGIEEGMRYKLAFDFSLSSDTDCRAQLVFYRNNGSEIGDPIKLKTKDRSGRYTSPGLEAPRGAVAARIFLGGTSSKNRLSWVKLRNVVLCQASESPAMLHGGMTDCFWAGDVNQSISYYWPKIDITVSSDLTPVPPNANLSMVASMHAKAVWNPANVKVRVVCFDKAGKQLGAPEGAAVSAGSTWVRPFVIMNPAPAGTASVRFEVTIAQVGPYQHYLLDAGMLQPHTTTLEPYFDGSTDNYTNSAGSSVIHQWDAPGKPHRSPSVRKTLSLGNAVYAPPADNADMVAKPSDNTLISNKENPYKMGFFYTVENEVGESAASKITEVRVKRPQSNWPWLRADDESEPDPTKPTDVADLCADQLVACMPRAVYNNAIAQGAVRWNLYVFSWSDQDPVPVVGQCVATVELYPDTSARMLNTPLDYSKGSWVNLTPSRKVTLDDLALPTAANRENYSKPPEIRNGLVAGDRIIVVGDADEPASIKWTSNRPGEYTNFTANRGGGKKTLSSGNLNLPSAVTLWQNPQSVDTITILCLGSDGTSTCYYMTPANVTAQSGATSVMGFEETTNTPGTMSPYGALVHNNALFRPIDRCLLKSTAQNYNINHKALSDDISNMWEDLVDKQWIVSAVHDNRLYFLVNNPLGEPVEEHCLGNEIWVYDLAGGENGTWSRFLIQASGLRVIDYGSRVYMGVARPDGMYYLDPEARLDDYVLRVETEDSGEVPLVMQRPIPWFFETNTQGANRAHDAWAHLQQVSIGTGGFQGTMRYGIRGQNVHGQQVNMSKVFQDLGDVTKDGTGWDVQDHLLVRQDMMEWFFYAGSIEGEPSSGLVSSVQYRYTPVSVNVGYEFGSVESFEYARNVRLGADEYSANGIPRPYQDFSRT